MLKDFNQKNVHLANTPQARFFRVAWRALFNLRATKHDRLDRIQHDKENGITLFSDGYVLAATDMEMPETLEHGAYKQTAQPSVSTGFVYLEKKNVHPDTYIERIGEMVERASTAKAHRISVNPKLLLESLELFRGCNHVTLSITSADNELYITSPKNNTPHTLAAVMPMHIAENPLAPSPVGIFDWFTNRLKRKQTTTE